ncbi:MAG: peptidoglycan DD-metalloendopeptidase family protein, partial [Myxococcota bacterium]|jgi:septal ring factor EnvC (AmiA/AmiB activator)|nr:peptidoglycan DD-metalloendopeptidase family protein [Myxococcota bacterium]
MARLEEQLRIVGEDVSKMSGRFDRLTQSLDEARQLVQRRLRAMAQLKRTEAYQVLFASESYADYLRRTRALERLLESDRERITSFQDKLHTWETSRKDLERRRENLKRTGENISHLLQQLNWDREEKASLLKAVQDKRAFNAKVGAELKSVDKELRARVIALRDDTRARYWFEQRQGKLLMPIWKGRIAGRFGLRTNRRFGTRTVHRGLHIVPQGWDGKRDVNIRSLYWGYIAHVGWLAGLGKTVIVDHTKGYMSLYAHMKEVGVKVGDKVKSGTVLGLMGDTGSLHGPRLYLEVRKDGRAIDPSPWFR